MAVPGHLAARTRSTSASHTSARRREAYSGIKLAVFGADSSRPEPGLCTRDSRRCSLQSRLLHPPSLRMADGKLSCKHGSRGLMVRRDGLHQPSLGSLGWIGDALTVLPTQSWCGRRRPQRGAPIAASTTSRATSACTTRGNREEDKSQRMRLLRQSPRHRSQNNDPAKRPNSSDCPMIGRP